MLVKGAAIEASASLSEMPTAAYFRAPQSLAPSPHMPQLISRLVYRLSTKRALSSGDILAYTFALDRIELKIKGLCSFLSKICLKALPVRATLTFASW